MADSKADEATKYRTFLKRTHRRLKRPANDHDRTKIGEGQNAIKDRIDMLTDLKSRINKAIRTRVERLETEERNLRELFRAREKEEFVEVAVYVDSRQGGMIVVVDTSTNKTVGEPRPLSVQEREVFASTKSQPELFGGDVVAVNEELAKKLNLIEYLAEDKPVTITDRVATALENGDLPEDLKEAILALEDEEDEPAAAPKKAKKANDAPGPEKKKRGRPKKEPAPAPVVPAPEPTKTQEDHPGPDVAEKDEELPKRPPAPAPVHEDEADDEPSVGDVTDAEAMAESEESSGTTEQVEEDTGDDIPDFEGGESELTEPTEEPAEGPDPAEEPPVDADIEADPIPEAWEDAHDPTAAKALDPLPMVEEATEDATAPAEEPAPAPVVPAPEPTKTEEEPAVTVTEAPKAKDAPSVANHFGFEDEKRLDQASFATISTLGKVVIFSDDLVEGLARANKTTIKPGTTLANALPALIEHFVSEKKIRQRKLKVKHNGKAVYAYFVIPTRTSKLSLTEEAVDAACNAREARG